METDDTDKSDEEADKDAVKRTKKTNSPLTARLVIMWTSTSKHTLPHSRYYWLKEDFLFFFSPRTGFSGPASTDDAVSLHTALELPEV